jgi:hypothetical protein
MSNRKRIALLVGVKVKQATENKLVFSNGAVIWFPNYTFPPAEVKSLTDFIRSLGYSKFHTDKRSFGYRIKIVLHHEDLRPTKHCEEILNFNRKQIFEVNTERHQKSGSHFRDIKSWHIYICCKTKPSLILKSK